MMMGDQRDTQNASSSPDESSRAIPSVRDDAPTHIDPRRRETSVVSDVRPVRKIGRYTVMQEIGRGGMGVVYQAHQDDLDRIVALKVIPAGPEADPTELARFRAEAETAANLHHPNIVPVYEVGNSENVAFLAMEYVDGGSLHKRLAGKAIKPRDAARLLEPLARGIHYANENGVVHRDLKPSNILLQSPKSGVNPSAHGDGNVPAQPPSDFTLWTPKIADFGLAKRLFKPLALTQTGLAVGTPHYMAPEQAQGKSNLIGPRTDVYALGTILYEMLTGHPPFGAANPIETMEQVVHKRPVAPRHLAEGIPEELEKICLKCLEKDISRRYPSAEALADDLQRFLANQTPLYPSDPPVGLPVPWWQKKWSVVVGGIALAVSTSALTCWLTYEAMKPKPVAPVVNLTTHEIIEVRDVLHRCELGDIANSLSTLSGFPDNSPVREIIGQWANSRLIPMESISQPNVSHVAFSEDSTRLACAVEKQIYLWKRGKTGWELETAEALNASAPISSLAWRSRLLAVGTINGTIDVWDLAIGKPPVQMDTGSKNAIVSIAFTSDTELVSADTRAIWKSNFITQKTVQQVVPKDYKPRAVHSDGLVAGNGSDDRFRVIKIGQKSSDQSMLSPGPLRSLRFSPSGMLALGVTRAGGAVVFDQDDERSYDLATDRNPITAAFSTIGNVVAVGTREGKVRIYDAIARVPITDIIDVNPEKGERRAVSSLAFSYDKQLLAVAARTDKVQFYTFGYNPYFTGPMRLDNKPGKEVVQLDFANSGALLYVTSSFGISRWKVDQFRGEKIGEEAEFALKNIYQGKETADPDEKVAFSSSAIRDEGSEHSLIVGVTEGSVQKVDHQGKSESTVVGADKPGIVKSVAVSNNGYHISSSSKVDGTGNVVRVWDQNMNTKPLSNRIFPFDINHESFTQDGANLLLAGDDGKVHVWSIGGNKSDISLNCGAPVLCVTEQKGQILAGCSDGTAQLWDLQTQKRLQIFRHRGAVNRVAFYQGLPLSASADGTARIWHVPSGLPIGPPLRHGDAITALAVWGDLIATGSRDRYIRIWKLPKSVGEKQ
jgi:serine/threonine protein kinase